MNAGCEPDEVIALFHAEMQRKWFQDLEDKYDEEEKVDIWSKYLLNLDL